VESGYFSVQMDISVDVYFIGIGLIAGLFVCFRKETPLYLKLFPFFLLITLAVEIIGSIMREKNIHTIMMYNIFTTFEFVFYLWVLRQIVSHTKAKKIILYCLFVYPLLVFFDIFFWSNSDHFHAITNAIGCFLVVATCIYYFLELFQLPHSVNLFSEPAFWVCSGLLFFYTCTFAIFGVTNFVKQLSTVNLKTLGDILDLMNILLYSSFAIAFLCRLRTRKSTL
jgi:hypothetical protein